MYYYGRHDDIYYNIDNENLSECSCSYSRTEIKKFLLSYYEDDWSDDGCDKDTYEIYSELEPKCDFCKGQIRERLMIMMKKEEEHKKKRNAELDAKYKSLFEILETDSFDSPGSVFLRGIREQFSFQSIQEINTLFKEIILFNSNDSLIFVPTNKLILNEQNFKIFENFIKNSDKEKLNKILGLLDNNLYILNAAKHFHERQY